MAPAESAHAADAPADAAAPATITVQVVYAPQAEQVDLVPLSLPAGSTLGDALKASGLLQRHALALGEGLACGVWAKLRPIDHPLRDGDRVEVYRPLKVDPKEARRQRYRKDSAKASTKARARPAAE